MSAYLGAGIVSIAPYNGVTAFDSLTFVDVGNVSKLSVSFSEERKELKNYRTAAGGTYAAIARIDKAEASLDFRDFSAANLKLALWGTSATATGVTTIEAMINSAPNVAIKYVGTNLADGKDVTVKLFKARLGAPGGIDFIGDDFGTLTISATLEADPLIVTAGKSQYFQLLLED